MSDLDKIEHGYRAFEIDRAGVGAVAVFRALTPGWRAALSEGHDPILMAQEIEAVRKRLDEMAARLGLPTQPPVSALIREITTDNLVSWYKAGIGTGYDDPGSDSVNGFLINDIETELRLRGFDPRTIR